MFTMVGVSENKDANIVDLEFKISPHKKVYINRITITGNTRTQDEVVRREIGIYEGGIYSDEELTESVRKIRRLGFFSDVKMNVSRVEGFDDKIDINFSVKDSSLFDKSFNFIIILCAFVA